MFGLFLMFRYFKVVQFVVWLLIILVVLVAITPHHARSEERRTVSWYVHHPAAMRQVLGECRDDPGHIGMSPDCQNARGGEVQEALNMTPHFLSPDTPAYWRAHPDFVKRQLLVCSFMHGDEPSFPWCTAVRSVAR